MTSTSVIVVGYGDEPDLEQCLSLVAAGLTADDEIVLVDNGIASVEDRQAAWPSQVRLIRTGTNSGFAGGANAGAEVAVGSVLVFVNSDLLVSDDSIRALCESVRRDDEVLATGSLHLRADPDLINSAGNPVHYTGIAWAGAFGEPVTNHNRSRTVASASGGFMAINRARWRQLGGFDANYFMYHEDVELSLRHWMTGGRVVFVPQAAAVHDYAFGRNARKMYHLEKNRIVTVVTVYPTKLLLRVLPALLLLEAGLLGLAFTQGWGREKLRSYAWLIGHAAVLRRRRSQVQRSFSEAPELLGCLLSSRIDPAGFGAVPGLGLLNTLLAAYWRVVWPVGLRQSFPFA